MGILISHWPLALNADGGMSAIRTNETESIWVLLIDLKLAPGAAKDLSLRTEVGCVWSEFEGVTGSPLLVGADFSSSKNFHYYYLWIWIFGWDPFFWKITITLALRYIMNRFLHDVHKTLNLVKEQEFQLHSATR